MAPEFAASEGFDELKTKPNRVLIIQTIGAKGASSFTELKSALDIGVGTLYYHLDALSPYVGQNSSKQYILTERGARAYEYLKDFRPQAEPSRKPLHVLGVLRDLLFPDSYVEMMLSDSPPNFGLSAAVLVVLALLAATFRLQPAMIIVRQGSVTADAAIIGAIVSWLTVFGVTLAASLVLRSEIRVGALSISTSFAFVPTIALLAITGFKRDFNLTLLNPLYTSSTFPLMAVVFGVWAAYILTISLRSAARLSLERSLVVALSILLINLAYMWVSPGLRF